MSLELRKELGEVISTIEVHRQLMNRRKRSNENYCEDLYSLMELSAPINLEYFVEGIPEQSEFVSG